VRATVDPAALACKICAGRRAIAWPEFVMSARDYG
jgi:hypothetical protein